MPLFEALQYQQDLLLFTTREHTSLSDPKTLGCCNDGTEVLYHHAKLGGNRATHVGVRG